MSLAEIISPRLATPSARRHQPAAIPTARPSVAPGQLWLIELAADDSGEPELRRILDEANVVIYDRVLANVVAAALPLGTYAEPATSADAAGDPAAARAARFVADGWSVVRLVPSPPSQRERLRRVQRLAEAVTATSAEDADAIVYGDVGDGISEPTETRLSRLDLVVVTYPRDTHLTIVVGSAAAGSPAPTRLHGIAGNGLAG
jgi:hypothetical protein